MEIEKRLETIEAPIQNINSQDQLGNPIKIGEEKLLKHLITKSLEDIAELKIERFLNAIGTNYPEDFHRFMMSKVERPLIKEVLKRAGGHQVKSANILGISKNNLLRKIKLYGLK